MYKHIYNLSDFKNGKVDIDSLILEINKSNITIALLQIDSTLSTCTIIFKSDISNDEKIILDSIIALHEGVPSNINTNLIQIKEEQEEGLTQGHFQSIVIDLETEGSETVIKDLTFPHNISLFSSEWLTSEEHVGDIAEFHLAPDTIVGALASSSSIGDNVFNVSDTVVDNVDIGYFLKINTEDLGRVIEKDEINKTITTEFNSTIAHSAGEYAKMTIKIVPYWKFTSAGFNSVGESKIGASFIPKGTILRLVYNNINGITTKKLFGISIDYLY